MKAMKNISKTFAAAAGFAGGVLNGIFGAGGGSVTVPVLEAGGADAISLINTLIGMKIDIYRKKFVLANRTGGFSGPAVKPVAVRMVYEASHAVKIPVIGMGGIATGEDAVEFLMAGATAVSVGTANFAEPRSTENVIKGIEDYMISQKIDDIKDIVRL